MKIAIGCDHAGYEYKDYLKDILTEAGHEVTDFGTNGPDSVDYPDYVHPLSESIADHTSELGILICGSANGVCMTANKHQGVRAAIAWQTDIAQLARQHNDANVVCLPARFISKYLAASIVNIFIDTSFEGGRHQRRVDKIGCV